MLPQLLNETHFTLIDEYRKSTDRKPLNKNSMKQFIANYNILSRKMNKDNYDSSGRLLWTPGRRPQFDCV